MEEFQQYIFGDEVKPEDINYLAGIHARRYTNYGEPLKTGCFQRFLCSFSPFGLRNVRFKT
jgi:hypothetical protein